jgi:hypothetical protein
MNGSYEHQMMRFYEDLPDDEKEGFMESCQRMGLGWLSYAIIEDYSSDRDAREAAREREASFDLCLWTMRKRDLRDKRGLFSFAKRIREGSLILHPRHIGTLGNVVLVDFEKKEKD